jgi:hypothetical protein
MVLVTDLFDPVQAMGAICLSSEGMICQLGPPKKRVKSKRFFEAFIRSIPAVNSIPHGKPSFTM